MGNIYLSAPRSITDLYSLFTWIMPESDYHYFGSYGLSEAFIHDTDITLDLFLIQKESSVPCFSIRYSKGLNPYLWCKDIHKYE